MKFSAATRDAWQQWDQDGDGLLSRKEVTAVLDPLHISHKAAGKIYDGMDVLWGALDGDQDGKIVVDEVYFFLSYLAPSTADLIVAVSKSLVDAVEYYDLDEDSALSEREAATALQDAGFPGDPRALVHVVFSGGIMVDVKEDHDSSEDADSVSTEEPDSVSTEVARFLLAVLENDKQRLLYQAEVIVHALDQNGDACLTQEESFGALAVLLRDAMRYAYARVVQPVWKAIDTDGDGGITADELRRALSKLNAAIQGAAEELHASVRPAFEHTDANGDGEIQSIEAELVMQRMMLAAGADVDGVADVTVNKVAFADRDVDGSGGISWDELPEDLTDGTTIRQTANDITSRINRVAPELQDMLSLLDTDGDGSLTQKELGVGVLHDVNLA